MDDRINFDGVPPVVVGVVVVVATVGSTMAVLVVLIGLILRLRPCLSLSIEREGHMHTARSAKFSLGQRWQSHLTMSVISRCAWYRPPQAFESVPRLSGKDESML